MRRGIVKSGNAGNSSKASSKASKAPVVQPATPNTDDKPLFPPGSKYPLSLLNERCQKNGWEKPVVDTRKQVDGYSFAVTLSRVNKKTSNKESVRLEPHPPYVLPSALEARHWGATYALYRVCNGIQLNRVLPAGPRDYWNALAAEHKNVPEHQKWMYDADPFAARRAVDDRQTKVAQRREATSSEGGASRDVKHGSREFENAPEAKMAGSLRELVEDSIKKAIALYPESEDAVPPVIPVEDAQQLLQQLSVLGFKPVQARSAITALSQTSPIAATLLRENPPLQACIEYLILQVPECDLPQRFLPALNSSNSFVTAAHAGTTDLKMRWAEEKAVKECGWPAHIVKECMADETVASDWELLASALNRRLLGDDWTGLSQGRSSAKHFESLDGDELEALGAHRSENNELVVPLPCAPFRLIIVPSSDGKFRHDYPPAMYVASSSVPAYIRLHLVSRLLVALKDGLLPEEDESFIMGAVRLLEEEWISVEDSGPPDMATVLQNLTPSASQSTPVEEAEARSTPGAEKRNGRRKRVGRKQDDRSDARVKEEFTQLTKTDKYLQILAGRQKLPAFAARDQFLDALERSRCVVVVGETGCGKTTQLPQFVLDSLILGGHGSSASIIVTQPRRLSAIGVAARVSAERLEDGSVGYAIRGESKQDHRTKLLFCTTGVVLRRLGAGDRLKDVTHVVVDEVHERSVDGDFLLLELKELLRTHPKLKVILMSATINHDIFVKYFDGAPLLTIPGFTHPVEDRYLEDFMAHIGYRPSASGRTKKGKEAEEEGKKLHDDLVATGVDDETAQAIQAISRSDRIDFDLIYALTKHIVTTSEKRGGILIFLPGVQEIRQCTDKLRSIPETHVLPLHANLSNEEQRRVFAPVKGWKVVAATNVAETSITIDDIIYVVDCGKVKETRYDPQRSLTSLEEQWVTRAAAKQRRGRAGRTQPGICYKLFTRLQERKMAAFPIPEIQRVSLDSIALTVKVVHNDVKTFLARAIDPPELTAIDAALSTLEDLGAVETDGELTPLGRHMAMLPVDLRLGKMMILGTIFQCLGPTLTIAAMLSSKPLFVSPMERRDEATQARACFATGNSDLLTDMHAYDECLRLRDEGRSQHNIRAFCEENFIAPSTIRDVTSLKQDFFASLVELGFVPPSARMHDPSLNANSAHENLLKAVILGALWPQVARAVLPRSAVKFDRVQAGTVQRDNTAREFRLYDLKGGERVFVHPSSVLFSEAAWRAPFAAYFQKQATSKVFLRDATEVPIYALLLFGGPVAVNHIGGGLTIGTRGAFVKLKAWPRIGVLVNQLRRLLDVQLKRCIDEGTMLDVGLGNPVVRAMLALLDNDGLSS
ncbi:P-loop containing nucleoside triphosphate hydrolase protein [Fomitopsis serialis]|uniref:P-loop containing nucleoside triphosphate hydrolase protein n=1 Tax=Fomitopsis serialis TaxID=139415 RepID=UPI002007A597|nr:P-loop containing nucleoside triphosphate hydrolase protein [Neoantrodia serialis]KAH9934840.1 P-loop containing nucleoside triphosphate hydrolase protein [Neoantrodia serialis]